MNTNHESFVSEMTLEEKVSLMTGRGIWDANPVDRLQIPGKTQMDRMGRGAGLLGTGTQALCVLVVLLLERRGIRTHQEIGKVLGLETRARASHVLLLQL